MTGLLDVFGQYRRSTESALASLDSAHAAVDVAKLALIKDLVSSYIDARYYQQRVSISRANLKSRQRPTISRIFNSKREQLPGWMSRRPKRLSSRRLPNYQVWN